MIMDDLVTDSILSILFQFKIMDISCLIDLIKKLGYFI